MKFVFSCCRHPLKRIVRLQGMAVVNNLPQILLPGTARALKQPIALPGKRSSIEEPIRTSRPGLEGYAALQRPEWSTLEGESVNSTTSRLNLWIGRKSVRTVLIIVLKENTKTSWSEIRSFWQPLKAIFRGPFTYQQEPSSSSQSVLRSS
jgi:hypothetical protein